MKRSRLSYDEWKCIKSKKIRGTHVNTDFFEGYIGLIEIEKVSKPQIWRFNGEDITVCDNGLKWLSILPQNDFYCITAMMNEKNEILLWYIDMIAGQGVDWDGIPYFDDLYLDLVVYPDGTVIEDDMDELEEALSENDITIEQYNLAIKTSNKLKAGILSNVEQFGNYTVKCLEMLRKCKNAALSKDEIEISSTDSKERIKEALSDVKLIADYEDGSSKEFHIAWEEAKVAALPKQTGRVRLHGQVVFPEYEEVLAEERADPYVLLAEDGWYYFTASYPVRGTGENQAGIGYDRIVLRRAKTIQGLKDAKEVTVWHQKDSKRLNRYIWAPELHKIGDSYYILFTGSIDPKNVWTIRPHMLKCIGKDLMNPKSWYTKDESNLYRVTESDELKEEGRAFVPFSDFSLDMTCFENKGRWYLIWAQKGEDQLSDLFLAEIDAKKPWEIISEPMLLTKPEYEWEMRGGVKVDEGPSVLKHGNKIFVAFSASATDYTYCIGMMEADCDANLLDKKSWKKYDHPFLRSEDFENQCGPGHNSFTKDENGNDVLVYHARPFHCSNAQDADGNYGECEYVKPGQNPLSDPCRHARVKSIQFDNKGIPVLHMTPEEELPESCRKVELWVTIQ